MGILISEEYVNLDRDVRFGESGVYETFTDEIGKLFLSLQREYGRCTSKVYVDTKAGPRQVGWVFQKRMQYEDARRPTDTYVREVWVTVHEKPDETSRRVFHRFLDKEPRGTHAASSPTTEAT